jgi:hypothetical protein
MACKYFLELDPSDEIKFRVDKRPHVEMTREFRHLDVRSYHIKQKDFEI